MAKEYHLRPATLNDAGAMLEIYRPYVEETPVSFEYDVPSPQEWVSRISATIRDYPWLVCEHKGEVVGYAYGSKHRYRTAYQWSAESTVYLSEKFHRQGIAKALYETLFDLLRLQGYINVYAGVTVPNPKSEAFHLAVGFYDVGVFRRIGFKFEAWHDTRWFQLHLSPPPTNPAKLKTMSEIQGTPAFGAILEAANSKLRK